MTNRITQTFKALASVNSTAFVGYMMGGDPDLGASQKLLNALPEAGVDIIELGMPFTDPAADGPTIEEAGLRSLKAGTTLKAILDMAKAFRQTNMTTPIIIMGYCNPVHHMGYVNFAQAAKEAGIDGAIIVDLPPEEDAELRAAFSDLPVVVGFGVKSPERAAEVAKDADGVVVGSAIVKTFHEEGHDAAIALVKSLADATHNA